MNTIKILLAIGVATTATVTLATVWARSSAKPTNKEIVDGYNALSDASKADVYARPKSPQWALVEGDAAAAYHVAMDTEICAAHLVEEGFSELLEESTKGLSEPCGKICEIMDACQPAFKAFVVASKTSQVRSPVGLWSKWTVPGGIPLHLHFPRLLIIDAVRNNDWSQLFAAARYGQDLGRGEDLLSLIVGAVIQFAVHAEIKTAVQEGQLAARTRKSLIAELRYLDQHNVEFATGARTQILITLPLALDSLGDLPELRVSPRAPRGRLGDKDGLILGILMSEYARAEWLSLTRLAAMKGMSYPERLKGHDEIRALRTWRLNPLVWEVGFDRLDARYTVMVAQRRLLLAALGEPGMVDPFTEAPFVSAVVGDRTVLESSAPKDPSLFRVAPGLAAEYAERLKVTVTNH